MARGKRDESTDGGWLRRINKSNATDIVHAKNTLETAKRSYLHFCELQKHSDAFNESMEEQKWQAYKNAYEWAVHIGAIEP